MRTKPRIIGVDFDNTVIGYDALMGGIARREGMIPEQFEGGKNTIRDYLRAREGGELLWQRLQAACYGIEIDRAQAMPGVLDFFKACRGRRIPAFIVSHKGEKAAGNPDGPSLRVCALGWLEKNGFLSDDTGLTWEKVMFGSTRREKIEHITVLGCTHFIDDLEETFLESSFPGGVQKILFRQEPPRSVPPDVRLAKSWAEITSVVVG